MTSDPVLTNRIVRTVASLAQAKERRRQGLFVAEGLKCVADTAPAFEPVYLFVLRDTPGAEALCADFRRRGATVFTDLGRADMQRLSTLSTISPVMAVYRIPAPTPLPPNIGEGLVLALDRIQDPGNLGTIVRTADWMGIHHILASRDTADVFSPKTVQATMGALARVTVHYTDSLPHTLNQIASRGVPIYGTFLDGTDIYTTPLTPGGIIVMGNEGQGISPEVATTVTHRLFIPSWPPGEPTSESLNVATATAITVAEFRRRQYEK